MSINGLEMGSRQIRLSSSAEYIYLISNWIEFHSWVNSDYEFPGWLVRKPNSIESGLKGINVS